MARRTSSKNARQIMCDVSTDPNDCRVVESLCLVMERLEEVALLTELHQNTRTLARQTRTDEQHTVRMAYGTAQEHTCKHV
jgi:hypothetical protein